MNPPVAQRPSILWRLLKGSWDTLNFGRRLIFNLLFLLILLLLFAAAAERAPPLQLDTTLILAPEAMVVEQYSTDAVERSFNRISGDGIPEVQLRDLLRAIDGAASDARINRILLRPDSFYGIGFASQRELAQALARFRAAGKEVIAYAEYLEQRQYFLAAAADEVLLHPEGLIWLEGLARYSNYYREAIEDKLGARVHVFRAGEYKSFGEPYVRDSASAEALEADRVWLNDLWQRYLGDIAQARGLDAAELQAAIDHAGERLQAAGGDPAGWARELGLVDELVSEDVVEARLIERGSADDGQLRQIDLTGYLNAIGDGGLAAAAPATLAVVVAEGEILDGEQPPGTVGGRSTAQLIREAREDEAVKAVVLRVNSPGGSAFASEQIRRELQLTREAGKPVLVSMGDVAASGGFWIAQAADQVFADPSTITGSIGVVGMFFSMPDTLAKLGIRTDGVATTAIAGGFDPRRPFNPQIGSMIQAMIDKHYGDFIRLTAEARQREPAEIDAVARGRVWSGQQALDHGLIDTLGGLHDTLAAAAARADLGERYQLRYIEAEPGPWERFFADLGSARQLTLWARAAGLDAVLLDPAQRRELAWLRWLRSDGQTPRSLVHCFCRL